jgi:PTS system nitrogen regulatory IIA component
MTMEPGNLLRRFLAADRVLTLTCDSKAEALEVLLDCIGQTPQITDAGAFREAILERESFMSTGVGLGIGVPHARMESISDMVVVIGRCRQPLLDYVGLDGSPVELIVMIGATEKQHAEYLRLLASITASLKNDDFRGAVLTAESPDAAHKLLTEST